MGNRKTVRFRHTYETQQPVETKRRRRVVRAVMKRWNALVLPVGVALLEVLLAARIQRSNRLYQ